MKKHLDTDAVANELQGASLFFRQPAASPTPPPPAAPVAEEQRPSPESVVAQTEPVVRPPRTEGSGGTPRSPVRTGRRFTRRHAFDIYDDQLAALRQLALEERMDGGVGSMSQMVREALDRFIASAKKQQR
jgi:hypothetical protein